MASGLPLFLQKGNSMRRKTCRYSEAFGKERDSVRSLKKYRIFRPLFRNKRDDRAAEKTLCVRQNEMLRIFRRNAAKDVKMDEKPCQIHEILLQNRDRFGIFKIETYTEKTSKKKRNEAAFFASFSVAIR